MHTDLPKNIRRYLTVYHMSQAALAEKADISSSTITGILSGTVSPTLATLDQISNAINVTTAELVSDSDDNEELSDSKKVMINYVRYASEQEIEAMIPIISAIRNLRNSM